MKYRKLLIVTGIILFISGCSDFCMICSLNPFYLDKNIALLPAIEGNWAAHPIRSQKDKKENFSSPWELADTSMVWSISQLISVEKIKTKLGKDSTVTKLLNFYVAKLLGSNPDSAQYQFKVVLFKINSSIYADFSPFEMKAIKNSRMARENYLTVHTLARISVQKNQLNMSWLGTDYMKDMIEKKRVRIKYRNLPETKRLILTASSDELTEMIERYADEKRFIDWDDQSAMMKLTRLN
jgi:hypothetical protein